MTWSTRPTYDALEACDPAPCVREWEAGYPVDYVPMLVISPQAQHGPVAPLGPLLTVGGHLPPNQDPNIRGFVEDNLLPKDLGGYGQVNYRPAWLPDGRIGTTFRIGHSPIGRTPTPLVHPQIESPDDFPPPGWPSGDVG